MVGDLPNLHGQGPQLLKYFFFSILMSHGSIVVASQNSVLNEVTEIFSFSILDWLIAIILYGGPLRFMVRAIF